MLSMLNTSLESFSVAYNEFTGTIPEVYRSMSNLMNLDLNNNMLTGTISANIDLFFRADKLQNLNFGGNLFSGSIGQIEVALLSALPELKGFYIFDNALTGDFPTQFGELSSLGKL